ncbi:MAG TPA: hypothetical protein DDZ89_12460 [Clostridiales bacterium]|nr:hypothetical protein [Clostridiales bacterium]
MTKKAKTNCESCYHYLFDDDYGTYVCQIDLDEDEMEKFMTDSFRHCPYYQFNDEYIVVRKQN